MEEKTKLRFLGLLVYLTVFTDRHAAFTPETHVTTVYKFNTALSKSDSPHYLNSCTVSTYIENNQALPLFNSSDGTPVHFTIPPLFDKSGGSKWKLDRNESLFPLSASWYRMWQYDQIEQECVAEPGNSCGQILDALNRTDVALQVMFETELDKLVAFGIIQLECMVYVEILFHNKYEADQEYIVHKWELVTKIDGEEGSRYFYSEAKTKVFAEISLGKGYENVTVTNLDNFDVTDLGIDLPSGSYGPLSSVTTEAVHIEDFHITYKIIHFDSKHGVDTIVSPWFKLKKDTSLLVLWYATNTTELNKANITIHIENQYHGSDANSSNVNLVHSELELLNVDQDDLNMETFDKKSINRNYYDLRVLQKVLVGKDSSLNAYPSQRDPAHPRLRRIRITRHNPSILIANIWEGRNEAQVKVASRDNCDKANLEPVPFILPVKPKSTTDGNYKFCYNGGKLDNSNCTCPPGFTGYQCEIPCNENHFGPSCNAECSATGKGCKGMVLCTESYGCSCAPGYDGDRCLHECEPGYYGANCTESCSIGCESDCDVYTGHCNGRCRTLYLFGSKCDQFHSHLKYSPEFVESNLTSVTLAINLKEDTIVRPAFYEKSTPKFFRIQYREDGTVNWNYKSYITYEPDINQITVQDLKPAIFYSFNVQILEFLDPVETDNFSAIPSNAVRGYTTCEKIKETAEINILQISQTEVKLCWTLNETQAHSCPLQTYQLLVEDEEAFNTVQIDGIKETSYVVENLKLGQSYHITLNKLTAGNESSVLGSVDVTTLNLDF